MCSKCGVLITNGKRQVSCCAQGGSWFSTCGTPGSSKEHTWFEGIEACKRKPTLSRVMKICLLYFFSSPTNTFAKTKMTGQTMHPVITATCPTCAATSQGKLTCCAEGASWFEKCGDPGDGKEHTWGEGLEACKGERLLWCTGAR